MAGCGSNTYATALNGSITFGDGFTQYYNRFTINSGQMLLDVSAFGGTGYQTFIQGIKRLNGSASGFLSTAADANIFAAAAFECGLITIVFDIGCSVSFNGLIGESTINEVYEGNAEVTTTWAYSDTAAPSVVWAS